MRRAAALALPIILLPAVASAGTTSLDELRTRVTEARALASEGAAAPNETAMDRVRSALGLPEVVVVQGRRVTIPPDPYLADLRGGSAEEFRKAVLHLDTLASRLEAPPPRVDTDQLRADIRAAYGAGTERQPGFSERIRQLIDSFFSWLQREAGGAVEGLPGLVLLLLVSAVAMILLLRRRAFSLVPEGAAGAERGTRSPADWRRLAREARARGDLGEAVACLYRALVAELAAGGMVDDRPSLTAREIRLATSLSPRLAALTADASRRYERVRYGGNPPTHDDLVSLDRAERAARAR